MAKKLSPHIKMPTPEPAPSESLPDRIVELETKLAELEARLNEGGTTNGSEPTTN